MRSVTALFFALAAALFLVASFYQWKRGRLYQAAAERLHAIIASLLADGRADDDG